LREFSRELGKTQQVEVSARYDVDQRLSGICDCLIERLKPLEPAQVSGLGQVTVARQSNLNWCPSQVVSCAGPLPPTCSTLNCTELDRRERLGLLEFIPHFTVKLSREYHVGVHPPPTVKSSIAPENTVWGTKNEIQVRSLGFSIGMQC
jgi:hypothetical protein